MSESTEQVAAKVEAPVDTTTIVETNTEYPPSVHKVHRQLLAIFDPENIAKDNFFRELVERTPEGWVPIKKLSMIKRFKEIIEGDLSLFETAVTLAPLDFEINQDKTQLRCVKKKENPVQEKEEAKDRSAVALMTHIDLQNKRSIYAKGFSVEEEPTEAELKEFYSKYGRVVSLRLRREGQKNRDGAFKGSIFVEFESPEIAETVVNEATEYKSAEVPLMNMIKADYVEMKRVEKYSGMEYEIARSNHRHLIEYNINGQDIRYKDVKDLVKKVHSSIGRLEPLKVEGTGVIELFRTTPEEFLAKLDNQTIEGVNFFLVSAEARSHFNKVQKENKSARGRGGARGGGRGGRGGGGRGGRGGRDFRGGKRGNDANATEIGNKRARVAEEVKPSNGIPVIATSAAK